MNEVEIRRRRESLLRMYFPACPLCGRTEIETALTPGGKDQVACASCGARWHVYARTCAFAKLKAASIDGSGSHLLEKEIEGDMWREMAVEAQETMSEPRVSAPPPMIKEKKEIIKEIVMISCQYCAGLMPQTSAFCPNCGARRKA